MGQKSPIARTARRMRFAVLALLVLLLAALALALIDPGGRIRIQPLSALVHGPHAMAISLAGLAILVLALVQLVTLLNAVEQGDRFSRRVTGRFRRFAALVLGGVVVTTLVPPLLAYFTACRPQPAGACVRAIPIDMRGLAMLLVAFLFFLIARLLDEARRVDEENRQII